MITTGVRHTVRCGGPAVTIASDGKLLVEGSGAIATSHWPGKAMPQWEELIAQASRTHQIPEAWIAGFMGHESQGNWRATSPAGAVGLMQVMPGTARQLGFAGTRDELYEPAVNIGLGSQLLAQLAERMQWNPIAVAAAYNAGGVYCYTARNCEHPGVWPVNVNCDYVESIIRSINSAMDNGFAGVMQPAAGAAGSKWPWLIGSAAAVVAVGAVVASRKKLWPFEGR